MSNLYFLSIHAQNVEMILAGTKIWEFRENPKFGMLDDGELAVGDVMFLVSTFADQSGTGKIECLCRVLNILRNDELARYFADKENGHWRGAGCDDASDRNWAYFRDHILTKHSVAIKLETVQMETPLDVSQIRHKVTGAAWKGLGLTPADNLKRYTIEGCAVDDYFQRLC